MPTQKRPSAAHRSTKPRSTKAKSTSNKSNKPRRRTKTRALAVSDAVLREAVGSTQFPNPLQVFEPLRRSVVDRQIAIFGMVMAWSPARIIANQQAAFWEGFVGAAPTTSAQRRNPARNGAKRR